MSTMVILNKLRRYRWIISGRWKIKKQIKNAVKRGNVKIIIGSGGTHYEGWIATDLPHFDILKKSDWEYFFGQYKIDNILAEHVLEHLTEKEVEYVLQFAYQYLNTDGRFRIAVPDSFHPDPTYIEMTKPPKDGHKVFWNYKTFSNLAIKIGLQITLLEYFDEKQIFQQQTFSNNDGYITRRKQNNFMEGYRNDYSSLILDLHR